MNDAYTSNGARAPETRGELFPIRPDELDEQGTYPVGPPTPTTEVDEQEVAEAVPAPEAAGEPAEGEGEPAHPAEEARAARPARDPGAPTQADRDAHAATYLPFRSWCDECVHGRRDAPPHCRTKRGVGEVPEGRSITPSSGGTTRKRSRPSW